jgi:hypothetical protein
MCPILDDYGVMTVLNSKYKVMITEIRHNVIHDPLLGNDNLLLT